MKPSDLSRFERTVAWLEERAIAHGLDFFPMRYEICPADTVYSIAGFGMPTRFSHWSFGKSYYRQKMDFDFGLSRIYELVINNDPCYAFFLENNSVLQNEMIVAHVLGHSDFFKNNSRFARTNRNMVETMAATAHRFQKYEEMYGSDRVEQIIDAALAISEHIDPSLRTVMAEKGGKSKQSQDKKDSAKKSRGRYDDLWDIGTSGKHENAPAPQSESKKMVKDVVRFIVEHSRNLADWEQDIVESIRQEMMYFWPQLETKIMNEGWATFWHNRLMEEMELSESDTIEFAKLTANVSQQSKFHLNPYHVGLEIWRHLEQAVGMDELLIIRESDSDTSFLRNYLTQDLVDKCNLYLYERQNGEWVIVERDAEAIRNQLVAERINGGFPVIYVTDADDRFHGGLCLTHAFEGVELDVKYVEKTLPLVQRLWGGMVILRTVVDNNRVEFVYDGQKLTTARL